MEGADLTNYDAVEFDGVFNYPGRIFDCSAGDAELSLTNECVINNVEFTQENCARLISTPCAAVDEDSMWTQDDHYDWLVDDSAESEPKKSKPENNVYFPKILKNDIRRYYSRMFLNTLNSADFVNLQDYFSTFMTGPCKFVAQHVIKPEFALPGLLVTDGPRLISHYCLGLFVMYPDMVLSMSDSKIVTSNYWSGSRIVMDIQVDATKMYDIDVDSWIPQLATLTERYQAALKQLMPVQDAAEGEVVSPQHAAARAGSIQDSNDDDDDCAQFLRDAGLHPADESNSSTSPTHISPSILPSEPSELSVCSVVQNTQCGSSSAAADANNHNKRKSGALAEETCIKKEYAPAPSTPPSNSLATEHIHIPEAFIRSLFTHAKLLAEPIPLLLRGQITMYLDENNHIQHMNLNMVQKNI